MKFLFFFLILIFSVGLVSALECYGMEADCPSGFYVNCWEDADSYNWDCKYDGGDISPASALDGSKWCSSGQVIDYKTELCCPDANPYQKDNKCYWVPFDAPSADNYYTRRSTCGTGETTKCFGFNVARCRDDVTHGIYKWIIDPRLFEGQCGYVAPVVVPDPVVPDPVGSSVNFFTSIINWIKDLFSRFSLGSFVESSPVSPNYPQEVRK